VDLNLKYQIDNEQIKIKRQWLSRWGTSEIHGPFLYSPGPLPMHRMNPLSKALLCTTLNSVNPVLNPSIDTILCVLLNMPAASTTPKMSFSVLRCLKTCVSSAMKNGRISSLGLMHIHRDFEVDLYKAMEVFVSAKDTKGRSLTILRYSCLLVIKIVLDSMLYETLKWPQIAPFCISSKIIMACTLLSLIYAPAMVVLLLTNYLNLCLESWRFEKHASKMYLKITTIN
jgi:hypothetical protein